MRNQWLSVFFACLSGAMPTHGQTLNWVDLFVQLSSPDRTVSEPARARSFDELIPRLETESKSSLDKDLAGIAQAFKYNDSIRLQASGLLTGLAERREDGAQALESAFPTYTSLYHDPILRIRRNAVLSIASLKPGVPLQLLPGLVELVHEPEVGQAAIYGLARSAENSNLARSTLLGLLGEDQTDETRILTMQAIGEARGAPPSVMEGIQKGLGSDRKPVQLAAIKSLGRIGRAAATARVDLESLTQASDSEISSAAQDALARVAPR